MGRTNPTYRDALSAIESRWESYRRALRRVDRERFDRLFAYAREHADAAGTRNHRNPLVAALVGIAIEQERRHDDAAAEREGLADELAAVADRLDRVDGRLDRVDGRLDRVDGRLDRFEDRLDELEATVDAAALDYYLAESTFDARIDDDLQSVPATFDARIDDDLQSVPATFDRERPRDAEADGSEGVE